MNNQHWILIIVWLVNYAAHSVFASSMVKNYFKKLLKRAFRYYRLMYSIIATVALIWILIFQYSFNSPLLFEWPLLKIPALILLLIPGLAIMLIAIKKYFLLLSGVRSVFEATPPAELKLDGIHRFVRHPLYLGTILMVWGLFFIFPFLNNLIAVVLLTVYVIIGIKFEEKKLIKEFGETYKEFISSVPALFPKISLKGIKKGQP